MLCAVVLCPRVRVRKRYSNVFSSLPIDAYIEQLRISMFFDYGRVRVCSIFDHEQFMHLYLIPTFVLSFQKYATKTKKTHPKKAVRKEIKQFSLVELRLIFQFSSGKYDFYADIRHLNELPYNYLTWNKLQ